MNFNDQITRHLEERNKLVEQLRGIHENAEKENRDLSGDELETEARIAGEIGTLAKRIGQANELAKGEIAARDAAETIGLAGPSDSNDDGSLNETESVLFERMIRGAKGASDSFTIERRDNVNLGTGNVQPGGSVTDGVELVPNTLHNELFEYMVEESPILQSGVTVMRTGTGAPITLPKVTSYSSAQIVAEATPIPKDAPQFGSREIGAKKIAFMVPIDRELIEDSAFPIVPWVTAQGGAALGRGANTYWVTGAGGTTEPTGIDTATAASTTLAVSAPELNDMISIMGSVPSSARRRGRWLLNDDVLLEVMKLKDTTGRYLWQPSAIEGQPDTVFGKPVETDPNLSAAAGETVGVFGDFKGFTVRQAGGVRVERSDQFGFDTDVVFFRFITRIDSVVLDDTGFRTITGA